MLAEVCLQQAAVLARRWEAQHSLGNWGGMGCVHEHQAVSSSFPSTGTHIHVNSPMVSQFTQMLFRFCITEVLFLVK